MNRNVDYDKIQKYKFNSIKWKIFLLMYILSIIIIPGIFVVGIITGYSINYSEIIKIIMGGLFGLSAIVVGAKTFQNTKAIKNNY